MQETWSRDLQLDDVIFRHMFECGGELSFIQIGAFDGSTWDPLQRHIDSYHWRGVLVEPQARAAEQLRQRYRGNERITIIQAALDDKCQRRAFFTVSSEAAPEWTAGLASFRREVILKHSSVIEGLETMIREEVVDCITFDEVLGKLPDERLDLLQIDAEGSDGYLLSLFPLDRIQPAIIHWEVSHLTKVERDVTFSRLAKYGYRFAPSGSADMIAVKF
jgi:FkbM family methyltransferase